MVIYWTSLSNLQACKVLGMMEYHTSTYRNGYLDWVIFQGGINKEIFLTFVHEKVLPYCNPWPGPCSVIVLDNASIHRDQNCRICVRQLMSNCTSYCHIHQISTQ